MVGKRQAGFTIIEITLFMGITGLLFLVALVGTGNTIRSFRFTDSGRSLEAFVQKQYDDIVNGLNNRSGDVSCANGTISTGSEQTVGSSNCLLIGKLVVFRAGESTVTTYNVIGSEPGNVNYSLSDDALISAFQPQVVTTTATGTYTIPWGASPSGFKRLNTNVAANGLLLIRSPKSNRIVSYSFVVPTTVPTSLSSVVNDANARSQPSNYCIKSAEDFGGPAKLEISGGASQSAAKIIFNATDSECNGV
jgi:type II secretory pathway pseudopilin PulG